MKPQFLIGSISSDSGKTLFARALICALRKLDLKIQPYKCGPDFMDAQLLSLAADKETVHLDTWLSSYTHVQHLYNKYGERADVCIIEGQAALFDGYRKNQGSSVDLAELLNVPIILLVNARMLGYSIAPILYGFKHFHPGVKIAGVVFNQVSSAAHYSLLREACTDVGMDVLGYLPFGDDLKTPSKHSVLTLSARKELELQTEYLAEQLVKTVDIKRLLSKCSGTFPCRYKLPYCSDVDVDSFISPLRKIKIAIARDAAFCFTYHENLMHLKQIGHISWFSPVHGSNLPEADLIYLPSGYIELFARQLHRRRQLMESLKEFAERGGKILAEGGGAVFLGRSFTIRQGGTAYPMCNVLPYDFSMVNARFQSKYRKYTFAEKEWKGHEYRYFRPVEEFPAPIIRYKNVIACLDHIYWGESDVMTLWD